MNYELKRQIEENNKLPDVEIQFYDEHQTIVGIELEQYTGCGSDMEVFLKDYCGWPENDAIGYAALGFRVVKTMCKIAEQCFSKVLNDFNWELWAEYEALISDKSYEAILLAVESGIPVDEIEDRYHGHFSSFESFCKNYFMEIHPEVPEECRSYISGELIAEDWRHDYAESGGHVFSQN